MTKFAIKFKDIHPKSRVKLKDKECTYVIVTAATQGESWLAEELGNREKTSIIYTKDIIFVNNDRRTWISIKFLKKIQPYKI